ncbi:MAG: DUF559 domain-containing protein [Porphyromonadaceae bacterium]|nr:MAG: DUF559 domain-containing protein [Porphyromonadaceae bacterium]
MVYIYYDGPRRISKARELRRTLTKAEKTLWDHVRNRKLGGYKIRRQQILNEIIVDFYCTDKRLCIEIDGPYHNESIRQGLDRQRDDELEEHGFTVLRFKNDEVLLDLDRVLTDILKILQSLPSSGKGPLKHTHLADFRLWPEES